MKDKNGKVIDVVVTVLGVAGVAISGLAMLFGNKQAKIHREQDKQDIIGEVLDQINKK
jgi:Na+-transporting NADH:ubiquinone oxidoreductase subunit NqrC